MIVKIVVRACEQVSSACRSARESLSREINIHVQVPPLEATVLGPVEIDETRSEALPRTLEELMRDKAFRATLGPETKDGQTIYYPVEREPIHRIARRLRSALGVDGKDPEIIPLTVVERLEVPEAEFQCVIGAFVARRPPRSLVMPFSVAVLKETPDGWQESYALG